MCTSFRLTAGDGSVVVGRTMEFPNLMGARIAIVPRGTAGKSVSPNGDGKTWSTTYGYIGIDVFNDPQKLTDGLNEVGLYANLQYMPGFCDYEPAGGVPDENLLACPDLVGMLLATCASVDDVRASMASTVVWPWVFGPFGFAPPSHIIVHDKTGASLVIEWIDGRQRVFDNPIGVATNDPHFDWHLTNLRNYLNLGPVNPRDVTIDGVQLSAMGQGAGMTGLPGDSSSPSRFVRAAFYSSVVASGRDRRRGGSGGAAYPQQLRHPGWDGARERRPQRRRPHVVELDRQPHRLGVRHPHLSRPRPASSGARRPRLQCRGAEDDQAVDVGAVPQAPHVAKTARSPAILGRSANDKIILRFRRIIYKLALMIFTVPDVGTAESDAIAQIDELRQRLRWQVAAPSRWIGGLRRLTFARAVQASNSIEGYDATLDDVIAAVEDEEPVDAATETVMALQGYRDAMTYVLQLAQDDDVIIDTTLIRALHFMMLKYDLSKRPCRWRGGSIYVRREPGNKTVYEGPDFGLVNDLMNELADGLVKSEGPALIRAAIAHLNLVMIHPFADGNGRMARGLQSLVLTRERILEPVFCSIEEYLRRNTDEYYAVLGDVGRGSWHPENNPLPWVRFCLNADYQQARTFLWRVEAAEELWGERQAIAEQHGLSDRMVGPLSRRREGLRLRRHLYRTIVKESDGREIDAMTASRDLRVLVDHKLLAPHGETRVACLLGIGRSPRRVAQDPQTPAAFRDR